ncbi:unnamed protein product [Arctia plantaginis]|uniref:Uncharacterized protein n=1 Tax=Arctia plantaginis TaxID=874455 RepID=A0A8S1AL52_ARCPL|nr:unnamed protein product [Arctia plantaginis]
MGPCRHALVTQVEMHVSAVTLASMAASASALMTGPSASVGMETMREPSVKEVSGYKTLPFTLNAINC